MFPLPPWPIIAGVGGGGHLELKSGDAVPFSLASFALLYGDAPHADAPHAADLFSSITRAHVDSSKNIKNTGKMIKMATDEKVASKPLENKALKVDTSLEEKHWSSIISISRVSAGKMQIIWCTSRHNTL